MDKHVKKSELLAGCLIFILLLVVSFGGGALVALRSVARSGPLAYGVLAGLCWGWMYTRLPRRSYKSGRMHRLLAWEVSLAMVTVCILVHLYQSPTSRGNMWWIFLDALAFAFSTITAVFRLFRISMMGRGD